MANTDNLLNQPLSTEAKRDFPFTGSPLQDALDGASVASQTHSSEAAESAPIPLGLFAAVAVVMVAVAGAALFYYSHDETMRSGTHLAKAAEVADAGVVANLAERFQRIFLSRGMDGVSEDIRGCYAASTADTSALVEKTRACMLYDLAAAGFDRGFRQEFAIINPGVAIAPIAFLEPKTYDEQFTKSVVPNSGNRVGPNSGNQVVPNSGNRLGPIRGNRA